MFPQKEKASNLIDEKDWALFLCRLREERPLFSVYLSLCEVHLAWDGVLRLRYPRNAFFARARVDASMGELGILVANHFGERVKLIQVMQEV